MKAAVCYRSSCIDLPSPLTAESLIKGQAEPPDDLLQFLRVLYTGSEKGNTSENIDRYVQSSAQDAVYATTRGVVKPSKHLCLGLGLKSLTGSRKILDLINHFGHCIGYHIAESLETDLASTVLERGVATPDGILQKSSLVTSVAWDNYDENSETLSGAGTLHDTVGICFQNIVDDDNDEKIIQLQDRINAPGNSNEVNTTIEQNNLQTTSTRKYRKRTLQMPETELEPYRKKPKFSSFCYKIMRSDVPKNLTKYRRRDTLWQISSSTVEKKTPMWVGWNSLVTEDFLPKQRIGYMQNITLPPTRLDVVTKILDISRRVSDECGDEYSMVHADLAVAKLAMQIQAQEAPKYDKSFINFGAFHITLTYFASLGFILEESGGPQILIESEVLASGSLNGFISGRHYNRCKRLHPLLTQAMKRLHFKQFVEMCPLPDDFVSQLTALNSNLSPDALDNFENSIVYSNVMQMYEEFTEKTRLGQHGKTAQYWIMYTDLVSNYLLFSRSVRTNDLDLFIYSLGEICPLFLPQITQIMLGTWLGTNSIC